MQRFRQLLDASITRMEKAEYPWRERCNLYLINDFKTAGYEDGMESMMANCEHQYEERLKANYLCPCSWYSLVAYTILDGRSEEAVQRADEWLNNGDSWPFLDQDPIFTRLADRPEFAGFLARNQEQIARQQRIYLARKEAQATFGGP
jgi:hypothetical protein